VKSWASISGTVRNGAGGAAPWGSWLTCEETTIEPAPAEA
jgi:secreted PhoX family phosphatase